MQRATRGATVSAQREGNGLAKSAAASVALMIEWLAPPKSPHRIAVCLLLCTTGCVTSSTIDTAVPPPGAAVAVRVQDCVDRTQTAGRDLGSEATEAFVEALNRSGAFRVDPTAEYTMTCDVSGFLAGSAFKRWLMPGWGSTVGQVAAMIIDSRTGETVLIARGNATVSAGGLYTIGADTYILRTAVNDAVRQMVGWARGKPLASVPGGHTRLGRAIS
jgi:hypothetical protein